MHFVRKRIIFHEFIMKNHCQERGVVDVVLNSEMEPNLILYSKNICRLVLPLCRLMVFGGNSIYQYHPEFLQMTSITSTNN